MDSGGGFESAGGLTLPPVMDAFSFIESISPSRADQLKAMLNRADFSFSGKIIVDLTMPMYIGGYYSPSDHVIALNPMLALTGSLKSIAHVFVHEGLHSEGIMDESLTELLTKLKMQEVFGGSEFQSGYDGMVEKTKELMGEMSFTEVRELIERGDLQTFENLLEVILIQPALHSLEDLNDLSFESIESGLQSKWSELQELFPRMMNSIANNNRGLHDEAGLEARQFDLTNLLQKTAFQIFNEKQHLLTGIFNQITKNGQDKLQEDEFINAMFEHGFGYLVDFEPQVIKRMYNTYAMQIVEVEYV